MSSGSSSFVGSNLVTSILAANPLPISQHVTGYSQTSLAHTTKQLSQQSFKSGETKGFYLGPGGGDSRAKHIVQCGQVLGSSLGTAAALQSAGLRERSQASAVSQSAGKDPFGLSYYSNIDYSEPAILSDLTSSSSLSNELASSTVVSASQLSNEMAGSSGPAESNQTPNNFGLLNFNDLGIDLLDSSSYNFN